MSISFFLHVYIILSHRESYIFVVGRSINSMVGSHFLWQYSSFFFFFRYSKQSMFLRKLKCDYQFAVCGELCSELEEKQSQKKGFSFL